jgi:hypothetical protein
VALNQVSLHPARADEVRAICGSSNSRSVPLSPSVGSFV